MDNRSLIGLVEKVGGRYVLSAMAQKRAAAVLRGAPPLVEAPRKDAFRVALLEIDGGRVTMDLPEKPRDKVS